MYQKKKWKWIWSGINISVSTRKERYLFSINMILMVVIFHCLKVKLTMIIQLISKYESYLNTFSLFTFKFKWLAYQNLICEPDLWIDSSIVFENVTFNYNLRSFFDIFVGYRNQDWRSLGKTLFCLRIYR